MPLISNTIHPLLRILGNECSSIVEFEISNHSILSFNFHSILSKLLSKRELVAIFARNLAVMGCVVDGKGRERLGGHLILHRCRRSIVILDHL